ncbi:nicotinamide riboside kinase 1 [Thozetella sp. PMI_491]|nr:nicotinamide riboside kinase 1 [Thozetella sp. PMI_491]
MAGQKAVVVGISGASSSGKTTLARLLRDILPNTFILHEDDFYKPEEQIPLKEGLVDWDCIESLEVSDMEAALTHIRATGELPVSLAASSPLSRRTDHGVVPFRSSGAYPSSSPNSSQPTLESKEDKNSVGECPVSSATIDAMKDKVRAWMAPGQPGERVLANTQLRVCLLDGFLLYAEPMLGVMSQLDIKLFLLVSRAKATQRREARDGYVTLEGFWKDPPGYVDKIVWPNYVDSHKWLFENGDVEGKLKEDVMAANGIQAQTKKGLDVEFATTLEWAVDTLMKELEAFAAKSS